ncbi:hypothetical protein ACFWNN_28075 [Lentzea sp. NPDC058450]|uniref:LppU/SCO3897 family protein n=1 Tax=Lentzea sp. NPDC058450 TaxID=3346505 RepID=UPI003653D0CB
MTTPPIPPASPEEPAGEPVPPAEAVAVPAGESIAELPAYPTGPGYTEPPAYSVAPVGPPAPPAPGEPHNPWAAPLQSYPPPATPYGPQPVPPQRTSNAPLVVGLVLGLLLVGALATVFLVSIGNRPMVSEITPTMTYAVPTTIPTPLPPPAQVGDCVKLTGSVYADYEKLPCEAGQHNYTVSKVLGNRSEKCGDDPDAYTKYHGWDGRKSTNLCLIPVFVDGACYDFRSSILNADLKPFDCSFLVVRVKVLPNTADKAACGPDPALALAYPEIKTTYCFTQAE